MCGAGLCAGRLRPQPDALRHQRHLELASVPPAAPRTLQERKQETHARIMPATWSVLTRNKALSCADAGACAGSGRSGT
eukprot:1472200-Rhodomonas_salina.6